MDFSLSKEEESVAGNWLKRDRDVGFPQEFVTALAQNGWLGICLPEEYGAGLGISVLD
jgi:acyl-CoA dehydrogenase